MVALPQLRPDQNELIAEHPEWDVRVEDDPSLSCGHATIRVDGVTYYGKGFIESAAFDKAVESLYKAKQ